MGHAKRKQMNAIKMVIAPHVVHRDQCKIIAIAYKLNEMAIGEIVEKRRPTQR